MTSFLPLFQQDQTIIFDLGNIINDIYTGPFNVTLTSSFFTADDSIVPADEIIPVSRRQGAAGQPSYFTVPDETASNDLTLPRNIKKAVFTVAATGQSQEEVRARSSRQTHAPLTYHSSGGVTSLSLRRRPFPATERCTGTHRSARSSSSSMEC